MTNETRSDQADAAGALRAWDLTAEGWEALYASLQPGDMAKPTPCDEWDVRALVDHAIDVQARYGAMLGYAMGEERDWTKVRSRLAAALSTDAELPTATMRHHVLGETSKLFVLGILTNDLLVHTWDLARAIGADEVLPFEAVAACLEVVAQVPAHIVRHPKGWGEDQLVAADADPQSRLLATVGRRPGRTFPANDSTPGTPT